MGKLTASLHRLSHREKIAALGLAVLLLLLLAVGVGSAVGGGLPFAGDEDEAREASRLPSNWVGLEPLLPLAPSLKDMATLKSTAAGEGSGVLAAESGGGGALRLRALPEGAGAASLGEGARVATERAPIGRPRPAVVRAPAGLRLPTVVRVPSVRRILATRLRMVLGGTNDLREIIERDLRNLPRLPIDIDIDIPRIDLSPGGPSIPPIGGIPLPGGNPLPVGNPLPGGVPGIGGRLPLNLTVVDSQANSSFDVLLVARGRRLLEAYRFRDRDTAGLAAQVNLRSSVLVADLLRDRTRLARVSAAPLRSADAAGPEVGSGAAGLASLAAGASRGGGGIGAGRVSLASAGSGAKGASSGPSGRKSRRAGGGSAGGGKSSSPRFSSRGGSSTRRLTPRRRSATRRAKPMRHQRSSHKLKKPKSRRGGRSKSSRPRGGRRSSGHGHRHGPWRRGRGHHRGQGHGHGQHDDDDDDDDDDD